MKTDKEFQTYLDQLTAWDFIQAYVTNEAFTDISETREIIKSSYSDGSELYYVNFKYVVYHPIYNFWGKQTGMISANYQITDDAPFKTKEDAEFYINKAVHSSAQYGSYSEDNVTKWRYKFFLKDDQTLKKCTGNSHAEVAFVKDNIMYGMYGSSKYDKPTFKEFYEFIRTSFKTKFRDENSEIISSYDIRKYATIKNEEAQLKTEVSELDKERTSLLVKEIGRTYEYVKFLESMIKK